MISQRRFEPEYRHVKRLLDAGDLGRVLVASAHVHWYRDADYYAAADWRNSTAGGGGSLMNQGVGIISTSTATYPGDQATITINLSSGVVELGQGAVLRWDVDAAPPVSASAIASGASDPLAIGHSGHLQQWEDIVRAIDESRSPMIDSVEGMRTVRLINGIYEAARSKRQIELNQL